MAANNNAGSSNSNQQAKQIPKDAQVITSILKDMGVTDFEPQVVTQLLEFTYRYVTNTLEDAKVYAAHANKKTIDVEDVQLAVQMQLDRNFTTPPPRDLLLDVARARNSIPLPPIKPHCGVRLPPDRYCMTSCNYELKGRRKPPKPSPSATAMGSAWKGPAAKGAPKRVMQTVSKTQVVTILPKPVIKVTTGQASSQQQSTDSWGTPWKGTGTGSSGSAHTAMDVDEMSASVVKRKALDE